jgi:hypothetical protein
MAAPLWSIIRYEPTFDSDRRRPKSELHCGKPPFIGEGHLERDPSIDNFFGKVILFRFWHPSVLFVSSMKRGQDIRTDRVDRECENTYCALVR